MCESRTAELRDIVYSLSGSETAELQVTEYSLCGGGTVGLKVKALVWKRNCGTSSRTKFIVWKRNCRNCLGTSHSIFLVRKRNCAISELQVTHYSVCRSGTLSLSIFLVRRRNFKPKNIPCVEAELQNFKSHNSLCAEANFKSHNSLYVESLWFLMQESQVHGNAGPKALCQSHLGGAVLNCAILAVATTGIVLVCSVLIKHDRIR